MNQAVAELEPLVHDFRMTGSAVTDDSRKRSSLLLTYKDESLPALTGLVEAFKAKARALGVEVMLADNLD